MNRTVFYSWQADLDPSVTRAFIQSAIEGAVRTIAKDESIRVTPVLDRDTSGVTGTPSIAETILEKIASCDVFVCDVSIVNSGTTFRATPNPNVLVELGYAAALLGWDRILLVQDTTFGGPDRLPFDLRGRRVLAYELAPGSPNVGVAEAELGGRLETTLREMLAQTTGPGIRGHSCTSVVGSLGPR
jgi:hypothetical protein